MTSTMMTLLESLRSDDLASVRRTLYLIIESQEVVTYDYFALYVAIAIEQRLSVELPGGLSPISDGGG